MNALAALAEMTIDEYFERLAKAVASELPQAKNEVELARTYSKKEVAMMLGCSVSTLDNLIRRKKFPQGVPVSSGTKKPIRAWSYDVIRKYLSKGVA